MVYIMVKHPFSKLHGVFHVLRDPAHRRLEFGAEGTEQTRKSMAKLNTINGTKEHKVVSLAQWLAACRGLLAKEKRFSRLRDQLAAQRRNLPGVKAEKGYIFDGPNQAQVGRCP